MFTARENNINDRCQNKATLFFLIFSLHIDEGLRSNDSCSICKHHKIKHKIDTLSRDRLLCLLSITIDYKMRVGCHRHFPTFHHNRYDTMESKQSFTGLDIHAHTHVHRHRHTYIHRTRQQLDSIRADRNLSIESNFTVGDLYFLIKICFVFGSMIRNKTKNK
jgi:hypothetical protein